MSSNQSIIRIAGFLFLVQLATAILSYSVILEPILFTKNFLQELAENSTLVTIAMFSDLICGASVFAIAVLLYPILRNHSERIAIWYVGQRLTELAGFMISGFLLLTLLSIGQNVNNVGIDQVSHLQSLAIYLRDARGNSQDIALVVYCLGAWPFNYLLFTSNLIPRFISVWGLLGVSLLFVEIIANIFDSSVGGMLIMMPLGLNEIFLGIWLIFRGFDSPKNLVTGSVS